MSKTVLELLKECAHEINRAGIGSPEKIEPIYEKYETLILRKLEKAIGRQL